MSLPYAEVIGDPIAHSKSPTIHGFWLEKLGIEADYRRCHVRADELEDYFTRRRGDAEWRGCNVTVPHKEVVGRWVDHVSDDARQVGALNTIVRSEEVLRGFNTDVAGIREALAAAPELRLPESHVATRFVVIGAGGAARGAGAALRGQEITFYNRSREKAERLADEFSGGSRPGFAQPLEALRQDPNGGVDQRYSYVIINASTLGMAGQPQVPINLDWYPEDTIVFDMVYAPLETGLLRAARERVMRTIDGLAMLIGQAAVAFELFFGQPAPRQHDAELRALLTA